MADTLGVNVRSLIEQVLLVFAALFPVVNPVGGAPVFLALTEGLGDAERAQLARRIATNAFLLLCIGVQIVWSGVVALAATLPAFAPNRRRPAGPDTPATHEDDPGGCRRLCD